MPAGLRALLRVIGGRDASGFQLASYLMFESGYTRALIELGYRDAMEARTALVAFMSGEKLPHGDDGPRRRAGDLKRPQALSSLSARGRGSNSCDPGRPLWRAVTSSNSRGEVLRQPIDDVHRAVLAAGAADRDVR